MKKNPSDQKVKETVKEVLQKAYKRLKFQEIILQIRHQDHYPKIKKQIVPKNLQLNPKKAIIKNKKKDLMKVITKKKMKKEKKILLYLEKSMKKWKNSNKIYLNLQNHQKNLF